MRITLNIADDVLSTARAQAAREGRSLGEEISAPVRESQQHQAGSDAKQGVQKTGPGGRFAVFPARREVVSVRRVRRLMDAGGT
jgi:hypothetical protein